MTSRIVRSAQLSAVAFLLIACADASVRFPVTEGAQDDLPAEIDVVRLDASSVAEIGFTLEPAGQTTLPQVAAGEYRIGAGDVVSIFVFDHPELTVPGTPEGDASGFLVRSDGTLAYPFIGAVEAEGKTVEELRRDISDRLSKFIPSPQIDVRISGFNSQRVVVGGEVASPTTQSIKSTPLTLLEAINAAGGMSDGADASSITVRRGGVNHRVDLQAFLSAGIGANNPVLVGGDVVSVPRRAQREAYLLGEIQNPSTIDLTDETVSLTQALTRQGGLIEARADARGVFVFRDVAGRLTVYQLDVSDPTALLLGTKFALRPSDVVYVTKSPLQRWNDTITRILPTVAASNTVRGL